MPTDANGWDAYTRDVKQSVWGIPEPWEDPHALFYSMKFDSDGNVRAGWNAKRWMLDITRGVKFSTRNCRTATRGGR